MLKPINLLLVCHLSCHIPLESWKTGKEKKEEASSNFSCLFILTVKPQSTLTISTAIISLDNTANKTSTSNLVTRMNNKKKLIFYLSTVNSCITYSSHTGLFHIVSFLILLLCFSDKMPGVFFAPFYVLQSKLQIHSAFFNLVDTLIIKT